MTAYSNSLACSDQTVRNTVTASFGAAAPITMGVTSGGSNVATNTFPTTRTDCNNGAIAVKKVRDGNAGSPADGTFFIGTIDGGTWSNSITFDGVTVPLSVSNTNHTVLESTPTNDWTLVGYLVIPNSSTTASCSTKSKDYTKTASISAPVVTGQLTLVCVMNTKAAPQPTPPLVCTNCFPIILTTPVPTTTAVPPTATPVPPTATVKPTEKPEVKPTEPVDNVAGEKTPGALSTPIAPSTGSGLAGTAASFNGFLALIGIAILGGGIALVAASRRHDRN